MHATKLVLSAFRRTGLGDVFDIRIKRSPLGNIPVNGTLTQFMALQDIRQPLRLSYVEEAGTTSPRAFRKENTFASCVAERGGGIGWETAEW